MYIPIILGTGREGRNSEKVANFIYKELENKNELETEIIDVQEYAPKHTIPSWEENNQAAPWRKIANRAAAFIMVVPEYNHGYPGEIKLLLDQALKEYAGKKIIFCAVSTSDFGGARVAENILPVFNTLKMEIISTLYFANVDKLFEKSGDVKDKKFIERIEKAVKKLLMQ